MAGRSKWESLEGRKGIKIATFYDITEVKKHKR